MKLKSSDWNILRRKRSRFPPFENRKGWGNLSCGYTGTERVGQRADQSSQEIDWTELRANYPCPAKYLDSHRNFFYVLTYVVHSWTIVGLPEIDVKCIDCYRKCVNAATMTRMPLRIAVAFSGIAFVLLVLSAGEALPAARRDAGQPLVERDEEKEDQVAKLFEGIRFEANISKLQRIGHRADLEQSICTSAWTDTPAKLANAFYVTVDPGSVTPELKKIALSNRMSSNKKPWYLRYSVAVWRVQDQQTLKVVYRIGVGLYGNAFGEFVDCHFTDDVHYCGNWKKSIAPACQNK